jgi:hypothetical protein
MGRRRGVSDTPRTDKEIVGELLVFASFARKLERELAAVTEERDELKSKYRTHHDEAERITNEIRRVSSVCHKLGEQRDRLAKALWSMLNQDDMSAIRAGILLRSLGLQSPTNPNEL